MNQRKFLLYPVVLFILLFLFDKLFLIESFKKYIKTDFTHIYYETREEVFLDLVTNYKNKPEKKFLIILGSSRLLYFDAQELADYYPNWEIYNLSSAVTTPAYYYYYLEKIYENGIKPSLIIMESDPNQFNKNSPVFKGSNLTYSFSPSFVLRNFYIFGKDNLSFYFAKYLFAISKNKPYFDKAYSRLKDPNFKSISTMQDVTRNFLIQNKGNALSLVDVFVERNFFSLESTSQRTMDWVYANYQPSEMQYEFYKKSLKKINENNTPILLVWPQSSPPMQKLIKEASFTEKWLAMIKEINNQYNYELLDMDSTDEYYCNTFVDGGHIAKDCYRPFFRYLMALYVKKFTK
jgi:hypothetical protein